MYKSIIKIGRHTARTVIMDAGRLLRLPYEKSRLLADICCGRDEPLKIQFESNAALLKIVESDPACHTAVELAAILEGMPLFIQIGTKKIIFRCFIEDVGDELYEQAKIPKDEYIEDEATEWTIFAGDNTNTQQTGRNKEGVLSDCCKIERIKFTDDVKEIGDYDFSETYEDLKEVRFPQTLTRIGDYAFSNNRITKISIPASTVEIGEGAFAYCSDIETIRVNSNNPVYESRGGCIIRKKDKAVIVGSNNFVLDDIKIIAPVAFSCRLHDKTLIIPDGVTEIGESAFHMAQMPKVIIPEGITEIANCTFMHCTKLETADLPESLEKIGDHAFEFCGKLISIKIPQNVCRIGAWAFSSCYELKELYIPDSVTFIGIYAFTELNNLQNLYINKEQSQKWEECWCGKHEEKEALMTKIIWR